MSYTLSPSWGSLESISNTKSNPRPTNTETCFTCGVASGAHMGNGVDDGLGTCTSELNPEPYEALIE